MASGSWGHSFRVHEPACSWHISHAAYFAAAYFAAFSAAYFAAALASVGVVSAFSAFLLLLPILGSWGIMEESERVRARVCVWGGV